MSKTVRLTYVDEGQHITEECLLVEETDTCYAIDNEGDVVENIEVLALLMKTGLVVFEDEIGLFCLNPELILKIEDV